MAETAGPESAAGEGACDAAAPDALTACEVSAAADSFVALVEALRRDGVDRADAVCFRFIEALARRGERLEGDARRLVGARLASAAAACRADATAGGRQAPVIARSPLAALLDEIGAGESPVAVPATEPDGRASVAVRGTEAPPDRRELKSLRHFRDDWSRLGVEQQFARALEQAPRNAGPLNSHGLVLQSLQAMRALSPAGFERTLSWLDTLLWLDEATALAPAVPAERPAPRATADKSAARPIADKSAARPNPDKPPPRTAARKRAPVRTRAR